MIKIQPWQTAPTCSSADFKIVQSASVYNAGNAAAFGGVKKEFSVTYGRD